MPKAPVFLSADAAAAKLGMHPSWFRRRRAELPAPAVEVVEAGGRRRGGWRPVDLRWRRAPEGGTRQYLALSAAAELLEVSRQRAHQLARNDPAFPAPAARLQTPTRTIDAWDAEELRRYAERPRAPGRPAGG